MQNARTTTEPRTGLGGDLNRPGASGGPARRWAVGPGGNAAPTQPSRRWGPIRLCATAALLLVAGYGAFHRIGTTANVETIEFTRNLAGGFLAVGYAERAPGFVLLSALERDEVTITAEQASSLVGGVRSTVSVAAPGGAWTKRLRGPLVVTVDDTGQVASTGVAWSLADLRRFRDAADCAHTGDKHVRRCGAPFADLHDLLKEWPAPRVPRVVRGFLDRHVRWSEDVAPGQSEAKHAHSPSVP